VPSQRYRRNRLELRHISLSVTGRSLSSDRLQCVVHTVYRNDYVEYQPRLQLNIWFATRSAMLPVALVDGHGKIEHVSTEAPLICDDVLNRVIMRVGN
jgi:hypothetical protein